jgi:hypothetical protein
MRHALALFVVLLCACGGAYVEPYEGPRDEPVRDAAGYEARIAELNVDLARAIGDEAQPLATPPSPVDCAVAADLRDRICDLAERICAIAQREPQDVEVALKCQRARSACDEARARVTRACP